MIEGGGPPGSPERLVTIDNHICGLPGIGFGGYVAGLLATALGTPAKVDFIRPVRLGVELSIGPDLAGEATLRDGDIVVATGRPQETSLDHPAPPEWEAAEQASQAYVAMTDNEYPNCFGCGPGTPAGRGMRVFTGSIEGHQLVAGAWSPSDAFSGANGELLTLYVWSALDCPGGRARRQFLSSDPAVTAYLAVQQVAPIRAGQPHLVAGWPIRQKGRKSFVGAAIFDARGGLCAVSHALWITATL
jgi:hypothetical protein